MSPIEVYLEDTPVRFTDDGHMFVVDAIAVVSEAFIDGADMRQAGSLWEELVRRNPELLAYCREFEGGGDGVVPVVDSDGWDKIHEKLFERLLEEYV
ncbi:hypothetical protein [Desulfococcus sp.]|uniref:hypothetical protein n=1 Tax=Desulfococcus sp. TaxID=2025834 RepID=UPI0035936A32